MDSLDELRKIFDIDIPKLIEKILNYQDVKDYIIYLNQQKQLSEGLDAKGQKIYTIASEEQNSPYPYSKYTAYLRQEKGLQVKNVDLKDTGAFWDSFEVKVSKENTEVLADFSKGGDDIRDNFELKFDFLGLTEENTKELAEWLLSNYFAESLRMELGLS